jgi:hypothetical protein
MFKKLTTAFATSAVAVLGLVSVVGASTGDSFDITGLSTTMKVATADYTNFTIANGDPNEEGVAAQIKVQPLGLASKSEDERKPGDYTNFTIANGDPNEEGEAPQVKVQPALVVEEPARPHIGAGDDNDKATGLPVKLNIGASDPAEQD